jgi:hypothetical protein
MSSRRWSNVSYLDAIRPDPGWKTEYALLASYSADLVALVAALLALAGLDDDRGSGIKVDFANAVDQLANRVRLIAQAGRLVAPAKTPKILAILDRYIREVNHNETTASWHPKIALTKQVFEDGKNSQWRLWIGSRNLTRDLAWDIGLSLIGRIDGDGTEIVGVPALGHSLTTHANLPGLSPNAVRTELRRVRWEAPSGCRIRNLQLFNSNEKRELPQEPARMQKLVVISPFVDGTVIGKLGKWGDTGTHRTLLSTHSELAKLAGQMNKPLCGFHELLYLEAPVADEDTADDVSDRENAESQDEEPEPRGLHAKLIYVETASQRIVWTGSANATQRGWNGPNTEVMTELEVTRDVADGLGDFVKSAKTLSLDELTEQAEPDEVRERLEEGRKQVAGLWSVKLLSENGEHYLSGRADPNPSDRAIQLSVGLLAAAYVPWPKGLTKVRLPQVAACELTELVCCRLTLEQSSLSWLQRAPMDPSPSDERDRHALARYLDPRTFLLWIRSLLIGEPSGDGSGDWDEVVKNRSHDKSPQTSPMWWAPTLEEVLKSWSRDPASLVVIDKKIRHYFKLYQEQTEAEQSNEERLVVEEFYNNWQVLRRELVREGT